LLDVRLIIADKLQPGSEERDAAAFSGARARNGRSGERERERERKKEKEKEKEKERKATIRRGVVASA